ncbi:hypothetical protein SAMN05216284_117150 [Micromonospora sediminimaris]|nr:hypothetical protein SAMN05216284_117150 [Micromonospora sediminimaris]
MRCSPPPATGGPKRARPPNADRHRPTWYPARRSPAAAPARVDCSKTTAAHRVHHPTGDAPYDPNGPARSSPPTCCGPAAVPVDQARDRGPTDPCCPAPATAPTATTAATGSYCRRPRDRPGWNRHDDPGRRAAPRRADLRHPTDPPQVGAVLAPPSAPTVPPPAPTGPPPDRAPAPPPAADVEASGRRPAPSRRSADPRPPGRTRSPGVGGTVRGEADSVAPHPRPDRPPRLGGCRRTPPPVDGRRSTHGCGRTAAPPLATRRWRGVADHANQLQGSAGSDWPGKRKPPMLASRHRRSAAGRHRHRRPARHADRHHRRC